MSRTAWRGAWPLVLTAVACVLPGGCVDRRFVLTSDPPTAEVEINGKPAGATPTDRQFVYYDLRGGYRIVAKHEGYETLVVEEPIRPPWYEIPPLDFISENVIPWTIRDVRRIHLPLQPIQVVPPEVVLQRATDLRTRGKTIGKPTAVPVPATTVAPVPPGPAATPQQVPPGLQAGVQAAPAGLMPPANP